MCAGRASSLALISWRTELASGHPRGLGGRPGYVFSCLAKTPSIREGCHSGQFPESHSKMTLIAETDGLTDFGNRLICQGQQRLSLGNAKMIQVGQKRLSGHSLEKVH